MLGGGFISFLVVMAVIVGGFIWYYNTQVSPTTRPTNKKNNKGAPVTVDSSKPQTDWWGGRNKGSMHSLQCPDKTFVKQMDISYDDGPKELKGFQVTCSDGTVQAYQRKGTKFGTKYEWASWKNDNGFGGISLWMDNTKSDVLTTASLHDTSGNRMPYSCGNGGKCTGDNTYYGRSMVNSLPVPGYNPLILKNKKIAGVNLYMDDTINGFNVFTG